MEEANASHQKQKSA